MKFTCLDRELRYILETSYYHVPPFQRPYSWEKDHIIDFWNDTIIEYDADYFIGSMVIFKKNTDLFGIVDGQQRMTTITMMLCALRNAYKIEGLEHLAKGIHSLIERVGLDNELRYILQTETSYPYFQEYIQKYEGPEIQVDHNSEEINLKNAFELITKFIKEEIDSIKNAKHSRKTDLITVIKDRLNEIRDKVLGLKVILVELDDEDDAYRIFETLNTRGKDLNASDMIKTHLIKSIKVSNKQVDLPKEKWRIIRENIDLIPGETDLDTFLLHEWLSIYEHTTIKTLYKKFKQNIRNNEIKPFLDRLVSDSATYRYIHDPESKKWDKNELEIKRSLVNLNNFRVSQQMPFVLSLLREYFSGRLKYRTTVDCLETVEKFHYLYTAITSQRSSGSIASMYSTLARKLTATKDDPGKSLVARELRSKMRERVPTRDEFQAGFKKLIFTNEFTKQKKIILYTLSKIDSHFNTHGLSVDYESMTIEHISPQNSRSRIANDLPIGQIGNLILIDRKTNERLGNKDFSKKQKIIKEAKIFKDSIIANASKWDKEEIESRTESLGFLAYNDVFKI